MADLEVALVAHLEAASAVSDLVEDRIYPGTVPQAEGTEDADADYFPAITYQQIDSPPLHTHDGAGFARTRMQINAWADEQQVAKGIIQALRQTLDHFNGDLGTGGPTPVQCRASILLDSVRELGVDDTSGMYGYAADFMVWHEEVE